MLKQGNSVANSECGARLHGLYIKVTKLGGSVLIRPQYVAEHECHYLLIAIRPG